METTKINGRHRPWVPSNATATRICGILVKAQQRGFVAMEFLEVDSCRQGCMRPKQPLLCRGVYGRLWIKYGSMELAKQVGSMDRLTPAVITELESQRTA